MTRIAANISLLYSELDYAARFAAAAGDGFTGIEILFPRDRPAAWVKAQLADVGLPLVLMNAPQPVADGTARGFPAEPGQAARFREVMLHTLDFAAVVAPGQIHVMPGYATGDRAEAAFTEALAWLCDTAPAQRFTIEPLNPVAQPGYLLGDYLLAERILRDVNRPNLGLQYDSYHAQMIHGDALATWQRYAQLVTHVQVGQAPNRTAPGQTLDSGSVNFPALLHAIEQSGYDGWISAEYTPSTPRTGDELGWMTLLAEPEARPT